MPNGARGIPYTAAAASFPVAIEQLFGGQQDQVPSTVVRSTR